MARHWTLCAVLATAAAWLSAGTAVAAGGGRLVLSVVDQETGQSIPCRIHLKQANGRPRTAQGLPFWHDHFALPGRVTLDLPKGEYSFELERGLEYVNRTGRFTIDDFADDTKEVDLRRFVDMTEHGWWSGDLDVRREIGQIKLLMEADDLHVAALVGTDVKNLKLKSSRPGEPASPVVRFDAKRFYSTGAIPFAWPGTALTCLNVEPAHARPATNTTTSKAFPPDVGARLAALREESGGWVDLASPTAWDLPMLAALGQIDSIRILDGALCRDRIVDRPEQGKPRDRKRFRGLRGGPQWSQEIYFRLLDCGLRIPPSAGSASGDAPNPVGYNRMYVHVPGQLDYEAWWKNLRAGRVTVTNGPLLLPEVQGQKPGYVFQAVEGQTVELEIGLTLFTREPISYLEIVQDGRVEQTIPFDQYKKSGRLPKVEFKQSGWFLLRAVTDLPGTYRFAMTGPYYVEIGSQRRISRAAAQFFLDWVYERARLVRESFSDPAARRAALVPHRQARDFWQRLVRQANAE